MPPTKKVEKPKVEPEVTEAIILRDDKHEVRRYTVKMHGEHFRENAEMFAKKKGYTVKLI